MNYFQKYIRNYTQKTKIININIEQLSINQIKFVILENTNFNAGPRIIAGCILECACFLFPSKKLYYAIIACIRQIRYVYMIIYILLQCHIVLHWIQQCSFIKCVCVALRSHHIHRHCNKVYEASNKTLRGPGSMTLGRSKSSFLLFLTEGSVSYRKLFTRSKNTVPSRSYRIFLKS